MSLINLNNQNFEQEVVNFDGVVLVDFFATWCMPCEALKPIMEGLAESNQYANVKIAKLDVDQAMETASQFGIRSIPTVIAFKNGQPVDKATGLMAEQHYKEMIQKAQA
ncbi:MAG: thioredoxin [Patescibacteria group bacterium]